MDLQQMISQAGGLEAIAGQLGIDPADASKGIDALLPAVMGGFKKSAQGHDQGVGGLMDVLAGMGGSGLVDNVLGAQPTDIGTGNALLGQIFGTKDVSRAVAAHASQNSGVNPAILKQMLPIVAMLAAGYMAKGAGHGQASAPAGGLGGMLGGLLGGQGAGGGLGGIGGMLGGLMGGGGAAAAGQAGGMFGGLGSMLDMDGDGNPLDDILGMAGKLTSH